MKTQLILKTAVVAMAAFGAFAFNGNTQQPFKEYKVRLSSSCTDLVEARCSESGSYECMIVKNNLLVPLYDTECLSPIKHNSNEDVEWK